MQGNGPQIQPGEVFADVAVKVATFLRPDFVT